MNLIQHADLRFTPGLAAVLFAASVASAQEQNLTPSYLPTHQDVLQLEKLQVNGHRDSDSYSIQRSHTATKTDTALVNIPQAITVITRELIDDQGMRGIGDVTRYVPGVGQTSNIGEVDTTGVELANDVNATGNSGGVSESIFSGGRAGAPRTLVAGIETRF